MSEEAKAHDGLRASAASGFRVDQSFAPNKPYDFSNPADQLRRQALQDRGSLALALGSYSTSPIKVFTVCVDQMSGKYMAFLGSDPAQRVTGDSRLEAVALLLAHTKTIVMTEID